MVIGQWDEYSSNCLRGSFKADHVGISENQVSHSSLNPLGWGQDPPRSQDHQIQKLPLLMEPDKLLLSDSNWLSAHDPGGLPQLSPKEISYTVMDCTNVVQTELFVIHQFHETGAKKVVLDRSYSSSVPLAMCVCTLTVTSASTMRVLDKD